MAINIYEKILELQEEGAFSALATVIRTEGSTPRKAGAKMLVTLENTFGTVGGGEFEWQVAEKAREIIKSGKPEVISCEIEEEYGTGICGGTVEVYIEPLLPSPKLYIFGAGHVGSIVAKMASFMDFDITVIDDREEFANPELFADTVNTLAGDFLDIIEQQLYFDKSTYVVVVTRGHEFDYEVLKACIPKETAYLGMMGSDQKVEKVFEKLREEGTSDNDILRIYSPIGLKINSETPAEIAVSILGQIIASRRGNF
jgi:xanthine dehydrogenase accessory factor